MEALDDAEGLAIMLSPIVRPLPVALGVAPADAEGLAMLGGLGYYFGLASQDRMGQILGIAAAALSVVSIGISGLEAPPQ